MENLTLTGKVGFNDLETKLRKATFRGLYNKNGTPLKPYKNAKFSLVKIYPEKYAGASPEISSGGKRSPLFTSQPTVYESNRQIMETVDAFLREHNMSINTLRGGVSYHWENRGDFHILPPIIEKHSYPLTAGYLDIDKLNKIFKGKYVRDARRNLHHLGEKYLHDFFIDDVSKLEYLYTFNPSSPIINYGLQYDGQQTFHIICDGVHRIDYALETLRKPITAILVESAITKPLIPYYAFPVPFRPTIRLSSKKSEKMYQRLERDKIHLLNDFICKALHYNWETGDLLVSKLRTNVDIY